MDIVEDALKSLPEADVILKEAYDALDLASKEPDELLRNFTSYVSQFEAKAFKLYRGYEDKAFNIVKELWLRNNAESISQIMQSGNLDLLSEKLADLVKAVRELEFRLGQARKARGGASFQKIVKLLLNQVGIPCEEPHKETRRILKRIDLVCPDAETARQTPDKAVFLATKRTLRERWKQVIPEHVRGTRLYLVTVNDKCSMGKAKEIRETGMVAYVKDELKNKPHLKDKPWIRKLSDLPKDIKNTIPPPKQAKLFQKNL